MTVMSQKNSTSGYFKSKVNDLIRGQFRAVNNVSILGHPLLFYVI